MKAEAQHAKNVEAAGGDDVAQSADNVAAAGATQPATVPASQQTIEAKPAGLVWSTDSAQYTPVAAALWSQIGDALAGTRYAIGAEEREHVEMEIPGGKVKLAPKIKTLSEGTAPLLAKYVPQVAATPETTAALAIALVFGPPAIAHGAEALRSWWQKRNQNLPRNNASTPAAA